MRNVLLVPVAMPIVVFAQSQPPSPTPRKVQDEQKDSTTTKQQIRSGNNQPQPSPVTVNQYNSQPDNGDKSRSKAEQNESASREWINTLSTTLLAAFTLLLFIATAALCFVAALQWRTMTRHEQAFNGIATSMVEGLAETAKAANAAKTSADALMDGGRAWVFGSMENVPAMPNVGEGTVAAFFLKPIVRNCGPTAAHLTSIKAKVEVLPFGQELPEEPNYTGDATQTRTVERRITLPRDAACQPVDLGISSSDFETIRNGESRVWIYGKLEYRDVYERPHETRFCFFYFIQAGFSPSATGYYQGGPQAYNRCT